MSRDTNRLVDGSLTLRTGRAELIGLRPAMSWIGADGRLETLTAQLHEDPDGGYRSRTAADRSPFELATQVEELETGLLVSTTVEHRGVAPVKLRSLSSIEATHQSPVLLDGASDASNWRRFQQGWQSWSNARVYRSDARQFTSPVTFFFRRMLPNPNHIATRRRGELRSELVVVLQDPDGPCVLLGYVRGDRQFAGFEVNVSGSEVSRLVARCDLDGIAFAPGETVACEPLLILAGDDPAELLERWADEFGARQAARVPDRPPSGWCSWYFYFAAVSAADVRENLAVVRERAEDTPFDYVMVDDGHQQRVGDWLDTNEKFPEGMAALASEITETGLDAGIWLAPFIADPRSSVHREHPDWFVRKENGRPFSPIWNPVWNRMRGMRALDLTHPEVLEWLRNLASHVRHEWGYRVLKLDFLYAAALPGRRHDPDQTLAQLFRAGMQAIRDGAGDDAFLLGCGCPLGPAVGVVDGMRIGPDVMPYWDLPLQRMVTCDEGGATTRLAIRNTLTRAFMHNRLWANDPDCVMVRTDRTKLTDAEVRSLGAAVALTDGMIVSSDRLDTVPEHRAELYRTVHSLAGGRPRVLDLLDRKMPELVVSERDEDRLVGVFNFGDDPAPRRLNAAALGVVDGRYEEVLLVTHVDVSGGSADLGLLDAHDARVLRVPRA
jgi:alpha-galactosidase